MPIEWYLMSRPIYNSGFENDEFENFAQDGFEEVLDSPIADDVEIYEKKLSVEPVKTRAIIQGVTTDSVNNAVLRQIICRIGTLRCGQYVKVRNQYWMINSLPDNNKMYEKAIAWQCRYSIKLISPITGEVVEYPVYDINSTQYGSGETPKRYMSVGTSQHLVYIPYNEETIKLDSGFRFLIDKNRDKPTAYRLAQVDTSGYSCGENDGLIQWTIVESQFDEKTDNKDLMVADYYGKSEYSVPDEPEPGYAMVLVPENKDLGVIFGEEFRIDIEFLRDGLPIEPLAFTAEIIDGNEYGTIKDVGSNYVIVRALDNREYIDYEITIEVKSEEAGVSDSVTLKVKGWY